MWSEKGNRSVDVTRGRVGAYVYCDACSRDNTPKTCSAPVAAGRHVLRMPVPRMPLRAALVAFALVLGAVALLVHVVIDLTIVAFAYAVVQRRNLAAEREMKVQMLYPDGVTPLREPQRRTVNA